MRFGYPFGNGNPGRLGDLELHRAVGLLLHHDGAGGDPAALDDVTNAQRHQVASPELAVDREVEERQLTPTVRQFEANANRPDLLRLGLLRALRAKIWVPTLFRNQEVVPNVQMS